MQTESISLVNREGIIYTIPAAFLGKPSYIGDKKVSYQILCMKRSELFSQDELLNIAAQIQQRIPDSGIDWSATFLLIEKGSSVKILKKLKSFQLA